VGIIGATGYVGAELFRFLLAHPGVERIHTSSVSFEGEKLTDVYPNLLDLKALGAAVGKYDGVLLNADEIVAKSDVVFTALPHGLAEQYADACLKSGKKLVDLSSDFRFDDDEATFKKWYKKDWEFPAIHKDAVYGLPELNRVKIKRAGIIGNPGCYVTAATLSLLPALKAGLIKTDAIIVDAKTGVTGAGRNASLAYNICECGESVSPYGVGAHRHQPEIVRNCSIAAGKNVGIIFTPHLLPMSRGIISTAYAPFADPGMQPEERLANVRSVYEDFYRDEPFVRVLPVGRNPTTKNVRNSNYCDIQVYAVHDGGYLEAISALDNMVKGAAGQAVQNMNLMCGFPESAGIDMIPAAF
jgi:N-acetyl-gamma-glutamyl-phosphate reductase